MENNEKIVLGNDGKYRWIYELEMIKNPTIFITVMKVLAIGAMAPFLVVNIANIFEGFKLQTFIDSVKMLLLVYGILCVIGYISYLIVAKVYGYRYIVLFEMDEEGVRHMQQDAQAQKGQIISYIVGMAGAVKGDPRLVGSGLLSSTRSEVYSEFAKVKSVKAVRRRHVIYVNEALFKNQVYVDDEQFDFVYRYITDRCPNARIEG